MRYREPRPTTRRAPVTLAARSTAEALEQRALLSAVWSGAGDGVNWTDPNNWSGHVLPGPNDDVTINAAAGTTVKLASGTQVVLSVNTSTPLTVAGGTLGVATLLQTSAPVTLAGGTIQGADIIGSAAATFVCTSGTLNGVTLDCIATIPARGILTAQNGLTVNQSLSLASDPTGGSTLTFRGGQTLAGQGQLVMGSGTSISNFVNFSPVGTTPLTIAPGFNIHGKGNFDAGGGTLLNQGKIAADTSGQVLTITDGSFTNQGTLVAGPGILNLTLNGGWSNTGAGKLEVGGGTLQLGGNFSTAGLNLPTFTRNGGTVLITGTLNNANSTLSLSPSTGNWTLSSGTIIGGHVATSGGALFVPSAGTLNGVTLDSDVTIPARSSLIIQSGLTLNAVLTVAGDSTGGATLNFSGTQTLAGSGQVVLGGSTANNFFNVQGGVNSTLTIAPTLLVHGRGAIDVGSGSIQNQGTISADVTGQVLSISDGSLANAGTLIAAGGTLTLNLANGWSNTATGKLDAESGTLQLGGTFTTAGLNLPSFVRNGGVVSITGALNNSNSALALSPTTGTWTLAGGTITGGHLTTSGGAQFVPSSGTLVGVTLDSAVTIATRSSLDVQGGITVNAPLTLASDTTGGATLNVRGAQPVGGSGQIVLAGTAPNNFVNFSAGGGNSFTIRPGFLIHGAGAIDIGGGTLLNQGTLIADVISQRLSINNGTLTNQGTLIAAAQATLNLNLAAGWSSTGAGKLDVEGGSLLLGGTFTTAGLNLPTFLRNGGSVSITGALNNANSTLALTPATGPWTLSAGTITGGHLSSTSDAPLVPSSGTLVGVTLDSDLTIPPRASLDAQGGLTVNATLKMASDSTGGSTLTIRGAQTLGGSGQVFLSDVGTSNALNFSGGGANPFTIAPGFLVHGRGSIDVGGGILINQGTISSDVIGQRLTIGDGSLTNQGTLTVAAQATLALTLIAGLTSTGAGKLDVEGGALLLGGSFTTGGLNLPTLVRNGGSVSITGSLDNSNATLALNSATGPWSLSGGTITGGRISGTVDAQLVASSGTVVGVTLDTDLTIPGRSSLDVQGGLTLNATLTLAADATGGTSLNFRGGGQTLAGAGQVLLGGTTVNDSIIFSGGGGNPLIIAPGILLHGHGTFDLGAGILLNQGRISADQAGQTLKISDGSLTNTGALAAEAQGILAITLTGGWGCAAPGRLDVQGGTLQLGGNFTTAGLNLPALTRNGGTISITGSLDNSNSTLGLTTATGSWLLSGGTITGGHLGFSGGAQLVPSTGTLSGVTIDNDMTIPARSTLQVQGGLTLNATLTINGDSTGAAQLSFVGTQSVTGTGQIALTGAVNNIVAISPFAATLTLGPRITLHGQGVVQGLVNTTLDNQGTIIADVSGKTLQINTPNFSSQGTATSANGGILSISSTGSIIVSGGNVVLPAGITPTSIVVSGGDVTFTGTAPVSLRSLTLSGGSIDGTAPITLAGAASWTGGTIGVAGGLTVPINITLTVSGAASHIATTPLNVAGIVNLTDGTLQLNGGGSQTGSFTLGAASILSVGANAPGSFAANSTISGPGTFAVQDSAAVTISGAYDVGATLVSGGGILELVPGARVARIGTLTVNGGTFSCGDAGLGARPGLRAAAGPVPGTVNVLTAAVLGGGITLVQPGWTLSLGAGGLTFTGATSPEIHLVSDPITGGRLLLGGDVTFAGSGGTGAILSVGSGAAPGKVDLGAAQRSFTVNDGSAATDLTIAANIANGSLRSSGSGRVQLVSASAFAGGVVLAGGVAEIDNSAALGSGGISFAGGTLAFGPGVTTLPNAFTAFPADSISLDVGSGAPQLPGLTLGAALNVSGSTGGTLSITGPVVLQHDLTLNNSVPVTISGAIGGAFALTKTGTGPLTFSGASANTYSGATTVNGGSLALNKSIGLAVAGDLTVNGPATVMLSASDQISPTAALVLNSAGGAAVFDLAGHSQALGSIGSLLTASAIALGSGTLTVGAGGATSAFRGSISGTGTLIKQGTGTLTLGPGASLQGPALQIDGGNVACSPGSPGATDTLRSLVISPGARMDLGNSTLMIGYGGGTSPADTIRSYMTSAFAGGAWSGPGLGTTAAAVTLGLGDSADGVVAGLPANTLLVKPALPGDANLDGHVTFADLLNLAQHYGQTAATWDHGDNNYDGTVGFADLLALAQHYGQASAAAAPADLLQLPESSSTRPRRRSR